MESKEERLLKAIFSAEEEPKDNYPETVTEKVGYSEFVVINVLQNIAPALQRLTRLHRLLILVENDTKNKLPDIITNNEVKMALAPLLRIEDDMKEITGMLVEIYRDTKPAPPKKGE